MSLPVSMKRLREHYERGDNIMRLLREFNASSDGEAVLAAYDLQAGSYVEAMGNAEYLARKLDYVAAIASVLNCLGPGSVLEAGVGEATTLSHVVSDLTPPPAIAAGFDISWSRIAFGRVYSRRYAQLSLFVGDLFAIPVADSSFDIVYTSHSIEPNRGREKAALEELYRVARRYVVLLEPAATLGNEATKARILQHRYCCGLDRQARELNLRVIEHRLFDVSISDENQTELLIIAKDDVSDARQPNKRWLACPRCRALLTENYGHFYCEECCAVYPTIGNIPCLIASAAILASKYLTIDPT